MTKPRECDASLLFSAALARSLIWKLGIYSYLITNV